MFDFHRYEEMLDQYGLEQLWKQICSVALHAHRADLTITDMPQSTPSAEKEIGTMIEGIAPSGYSELYEYGLAHVNKTSKKSLGQYYTPEDTCRFMASFLLDEVNAPDVAQVIEPCCGCGNLLMPLLSDSNANWDTIKEKLRIFDIDPIAIMITKMRIIIEFAAESATVSFSDIKSEVGDFLMNDMSIGEGDIVIMNPPYGKCDGSMYENYRTSNINDLYPLFLEKVAPARHAVSIVPQSFIGAGSYKTLRNALSDLSHGRIWAYDNVPAPMFNGRKHGIFNTNTSNSVRAAIIDSKRGNGKFAISPLIRWKAEERELLFDHSLSAIENAESTWSGEDPWGKVPCELEQLHKSSLSMPRLSFLISAAGRYSLDVPTSPRYFTSAAHKQLERGAKHVLLFDTFENMCLAYIILNSSWAYAWWRFYDGGITLTKSLIMDIPVPQNADMQSIISQAKRLFEQEAEYTVYKKNAGKMNENIKFPEKIVNENTRMLFPEASEHEIEAFKNMHSNSIEKE